MILEPPKSSVPLRLWYVLVVLVLIGGIELGTKGEIFGLIIAALFALPTLWLRKDIQTRIKTIATGTYGALFVCFTIYSFTPQGRTAYTNYERKLEHDTLVEKQVNETNKPREFKQQTEEPAKEASSKPTLQSTDTSAVFDPIFAVPNGTVPVYRILEDKPEQEGYARYLRALIVVPPGLSRATLEANIRHAAKTLYERHHPTGMFVFASKEGTDLNYGYTAGRCDFHPISKEKDDPTLTLADFKIDIDLDKDYFQNVVSEPKSTGHPEIDKMFGIDHNAWKSIHKKFDEAQRRHIYYEIGVLSERASDEALKKYPDDFTLGSEAGSAYISKRNQLEEDLTKLYKKNAAKKYRLTNKELQSIEWEGTDGHWPQPPPPSN